MGHACSITRRRPYAGTLFALATATVEPVSAFQTLGSTLDAATPEAVKNSGIV
jgi:hypothetical protein